MKYMFGLKQVERSVLVESIKPLLSGSDEFAERVLDSLATVLNEVLEKADYDDFDRAVVQLTARMIACSRAAYDSLRLGHLVSAIDMARDVLETHVTCHYLAKNRLQASDWISATTLKERRKFEFSRVVKSFDAETQEALRGIYTLFSGDVHANHMAVPYVRFRKPMGLNFYLSGCNQPQFLASILEHCCEFSLYQLESLRDWYHELHRVSEVCPDETIADLREKLSLTKAQLHARTNRAEKELEASECAENLSLEEIRLAKSITEQVGLSENRQL